MGCSFRFFYPLQNGKARLRVCAVATLFLTALMAKANSHADDGVPSPPTDSPSVADDSGKVSSTQVDQQNLKQLILRLGAETRQSIAEERIDDAVISQRNIVIAMKALDGLSSWAQLDDRALLAELEKTSKLSQDQIKIYGIALGAYRRGLERSEKNDLKMAEALFAQAIQGFNALFGEKSISLAASLVGLSNLKVKTGELDEARSLALRAAAIIPNMTGKGHPRYTQAMSTAAFASLHLKEYVDSEIQFREALTWQRKLFGQSGLPYAHSLVHFARLMLELERIPEAEAACLQAISNFSAVEGFETVQMAHLFIIKADIKLFCMDYEGAETDLKQSLAISEKTLPHSLMMKFTALSNYADLLRKIGATDRAIKIEAQLKSAQSELDGQAN